MSIDSAMYVDFPICQQHFSVIRYILMMAIAIDMEFQRDIAIVFWQHFYSSFNIQNGTFRQEAHSWEGERTREEENIKKIENFKGFSNQLTLIVSLFWWSMIIIMW